MLLSEDELERLHARFPYPRFSKEEYRRRYENIRKMMGEMKLDYILIIGGSAAYGRLWFNFRYITNMIGKAEMANYCFFPKEGEPCIILRPGHSLAGPFSGRRDVGAYRGEGSYRWRPQCHDGHRADDSRARLR